MNQADHTKIIPAQYTGKEIEAEAEIDLDSVEKANDLYAAARKKLLNVNEWHEVAGTFSAKFSLVDVGGNEVKRLVTKGDYFKVSIHGPANNEGDGFDWVHVEEVKEINNQDVQSTAIRVRPCANPFGNKDEIAHFYSEESTSNFIITREGRSVKASIIDRNIKPNTNASSLSDKIRDVAVGIGGLGIFSKIQWQGLADGLIAS